MKFTRTALLSATEDALATHRRNYDDEERRRAAIRDEHGQRWIEKYGESWSAAALRIRRLIKNGTPVTDADLPERGARTFNPPWEAWAQDAYRVPSELVALRDALRVITDDEVSPHNLREMGITSATLRSAVQHMAAANAKAEVKPV
jgi:hypothetical protein